MYYGNIKTFNSENGYGLRVTLFVSGCTNCCEGCFNKETWNFKYGSKFTEETLEYIIQELRKPFYDGLTILGGEPMELSNQKEVSQIIKRVKKELPQRDIWLYTGNTYPIDFNVGGRRYVPNTTEEILANIDYLVDGKFDINQRDLTLNFRGSRNQRIIDMKKSMEQKEVVLSPLNN